jgi:oligoribonuclease NrnB/cAMP/cGMP phosphodiesterase (DHH superfamily)
MSKIGIYHSRDLDGWTSGAIIAKANKGIKLVGFNYGEDEELFKLPDNLEVIMADVSVKMPVFDRLMEEKNWKITWIDHHALVIKECEEFYPKGHPNLTTIFNTKISACEGCWKYFFPDDDMPKTVEMLGVFDTFRGQHNDNWETEIIPFQYAMQSIVSDPSDFPDEFWRSQDSFIDKKIQEGVAINNYKIKTQAALAKQSAYEIEFDGYRALCINSSELGIFQFESMYNEKKHDVLIRYQFNGTEWVASIYTKKNIDVSKIAKKFGGGGHKQASGFQVKDPKIFMHNEKLDEQLKGIKRLL